MSLVLIIRKKLRKIDFQLLRASADFRFALSLFISILIHVGVLMKYGEFSSPDTRGGQVPLSVKLRGPQEAVPAKSEGYVVGDLLSPEVSRDTGKSSRALVALADHGLVADGRIETSKRFDKPQRMVEKESPAEDSSRVERSDVITEGSSASITGDIPRQADQSPGMPLPSVTIPVRKAEIEFSLYSGEESTPIGSVRHSFKSAQTDTGEYYNLDVLQSAGPPTGENSSNVRLNVGGRILGDELVARRYSLKGESALRFFSLREASVPVSAASELRGNTPDGLIDRQTLLYYFSRRPPSFEGGGIWLADHSRNGYYRYRVEGFEDFPMPGQGSLRTLKVVVSESAKGETIELWLAPDARYLPVRVRHKDRNGLVTDQVAISLSVE